MTLPWWPYTPTNLVPFRKAGQNTMIAEPFAVWLLQFATQKGEYLSELREIIFLADDSANNGSSGRSDWVLLRPITAEFEKVGIELKLDTSGVHLEFFCGDLGLHGGNQD